jgi:hypothetical protein
MQAVKLRVKISKSYTPAATKRQRQARRPQGFVNES